MRVTTLALLAVLALAGCGSPAGTSAESGAATGDLQTVTVAAASDLKFAFDEIVALVAEQHPGVDVKVTYGSSGQFVQQIRNGAPFDLYLSADRAYVDTLVSDGLAAEADVFDYAVGRLVTWYPAGAPPQGDGLAGLTDPSVRTVAIANPEHAPYGRAALAALESTGHADAVTSKLVLGENVAQAAEFARTGNADAAIVALSLVLADPVRGVGTWTEVPLDTYPRLDQAGVVLSDAQHPDAARLVRDTMLGDAGRAILDRYGFSLPSGVP
jgi:molybdate transport system substrate-binding protein